MTSIKLAYWENSRNSSFSLSPKVEGSEKEKEELTESWQEEKRKKVRDLVREKVSTFATTLSVVDNASAVREMSQPFSPFFSSRGEILPVSSIVPDY